MNATGKEIAEQQSTDQARALDAVMKALEAQKAAMAALKAAISAINTSSPQTRDLALKAFQEANDEASKLENEAKSLITTQSPDNMTKDQPAPLIKEQSATGMAPSGEKSWQIYAGQGAGLASVSFSLNRSNGFIFGDDTALLGNAFTDVKLSAPLSKSSDNTTLGTLDGLANAASISFSYREFIKRGDPYSALNMWGMAAKVGTQQFTFYDSTSLSKQQKTKAPSSASIYVATQLSGSDSEPSPTIVFGKFEYQNSYSDAKSKVKCASPSSTLNCIYGPIGIPDNSVKRIFSIGLHHLGAFGQFDLAPTISYDNVSSVKGIDFPIYLWGVGTEDKPAGLSGGLDIGWRSDTHNTVFGVFVGTPFSFWSF